MYTLLMLFICVILSAISCELSIGSLYVGGYCGLSENRLYVFGKLCPVGFLVVCECSSVSLQSIFMSYVD